MFDIEQVFNVFSAAANGISSAVDLGEKIKGLIMGDTKAAEQLAAQNNYLLSAQENLIKGQQLISELLQQNQQLSEQLNQFETWENEKNQYQIVEIASLSYAYAKTTTDGTATPPYFCFNCFGNRKLQPLQFSGQVQEIDSYVHKVLTCDNCGKNALLNTQKPASSNCKAAGWDFHPYNYL